MVELTHFVNLTDLFLLNYEAGGHIDTHRHMNTQTPIPTYRPKQPRGQVSVLGIYLHTD